MKSLPLPPPPSSGFLVGGGGGRHFFFEFTTMTARCPLEKGKRIDVIDVYMVIYKKKYIFFVVLVTVVVIINERKSEIEEKEIGENKIK